jgi:hypothetical protein
VAQSSVASDVHQSLNVHLDSLSQVAFDFTLRFENRPDPAQFVFAQINDASVKVDCGLFENRACARTTDAVDICQPNLGSFVWWKIDASYTCHFFLTSLQFISVWRLANSQTAIENRQYLIPAAVYVWG